MYGRIIRSVVIIAVLLLTAGSFVQAQEPGLKIDFPFVAAGKTLVAGTYTVDIAANGNVVITPEKGGAALEVPQQKVLSKRNVDRAEIVFDVVGSARFLSEVWLPGKGGVLVNRAAEVTERQTVKGPKAPKK